MPDVTKSAPASATAGAVHKTQNDQSSVVKDAREAVGSVIKGSNPGSGESARASEGVVIEGLGDLNARTEAHVEDHTAGSGDFVVVLHDYVTGVSGGYLKGDVRRISNIVRGFGDELRLMEARTEAKRLFDNKAIRLATNEEKGQSRVELGLESDELTLERNKRIDLERQIDELKKRQSLDATIETPKELQGTPPATADWK